MMLTAWAIFRGSFVLQVATAAIVAIGMWKGNNLYQRNVGATAVIEKVEKKANEDAKTADAVRDAVASKRGGVRDPNKRPGSGGAQ
jgi:hypothetical protein